MKNKRFLIILSTAAVLLLIPFLAMQFTSEVSWTAADFLVMGILLFSLGFGLELILRKVHNPKHRLIFFIGIIGAFLIIWGELAVGILGTPFAGS